MSRDEQIERAYFTGYNAGESCADRDLLSKGICIGLCCGVVFGIVMTWMVLS